jgi:hypothetical protein
LKNNKGENKMKKIAIIALVAMIAGIASADLSVDWKSESGAVTGSDGGTDYLVGSTVQLIWSSSAAITAAGGYDLAALQSAGAFYVLDTTTTTPIWTGVGGIFGNADVGGNNINSGYFYTRVFQSSGALGEYFLDIPMAAGGDYVYSATDPATTYSTDVVSGTPWVGANGTTVVPEPATIGLFGLGALSAWIIRRNKAKATEEA